MLTKQQNIQSVVEKKLCVGCGTCFALCPRSAIKLVIDKAQGVYIPEVDTDKCNFCQICIKVCPGSDVDFNHLNKAIFGKHPEDKLIGNYLECYVGRSTDSSILQNATNGGLVTALLVFALEEKVINGALVTGWNPDNPLQPLTFIARTKEELLSAGKSKYCPVPVNAAIKEILEAQESEKFAVVGLPCHIHGLRKAEQINQKLKNKIILHLGLFCGNISTFKGVDFLFKKVGIKKDEIARFDFRSGGLPSNLLIVKKDNIVKKVPHKKAFSILKTFSPSYCRLCCDATNELSDISFGDAWLPQFIATNTATSIMICRSHLGKSLVDAAKFKKAVMLNDATAEDVLKSQTTLIYTRKRLANATQRLHRKSSFFEGASLQKPDMVDYALAVYQQLFNLYSSKLSTDVLVYIPSIIMRIQTMPIALWSFYWNHKRK